MIDNQTKRIEELRIFFRISNAAFDFKNAMQSYLYGVRIPSRMEQLHKMALQEIEKENPDLSGTIDALLAEMESLAELNSKLNPKFPKK